MKKHIAVLLMLMLILLPASAFASVGVRKSNVNVGVATDLNFDQPCTTDTFDGSVYKRTSCTTGDQTFQSSLLAIGRVGASSSASSSSTNLNPANLPYTIMKKSVGNLNGLDTTPGTTLQNGTAGQVLILEVEQIGTGTWVVTPVTSTGFSSITLTAAGQSVALLYVSDTVGWVLLGASPSITTSGGAISGTSITVTGAAVAGTTVTAGTGVTSTTGNIAASAGAVTAGTSVSATTTVTAGTGITATTGNIAASSGNVSASGTVTGTTGLVAGASGDVTFRTSLLANGRAGGASSASSSSTNLQINALNYSVLYKDVGGAGGLDNTGVGTVLANGTKGQVISFVIGILQTNGTWVLTPTTKTGFSKITFSASGQFAELLYVDDTTGWVIMGLGGATPSYTFQ